VKKEIMFGDHTYLSGVTKSLSEHFRNVAGEVDAAFKGRTFRSILDIGSNDGTQLKHYQALRRLGVESSKTTAESPTIVACRPSTRSSTSRLCAAPGGSSTS
jgi:hypothetical protein